MTTLEKLTDIIQTGKLNQFNVKNKKDKPYKELGASTIRVYITNIQKLHRELKIDKSIINIDWLLDTKIITEYINKLNSPNTRKNYLSTIITLLCSDIKKYEDTLNYYIKLASSNILDIKVEMKKDKACSGEKVISMEEYDDMLIKLSKIKKYETDYLIFLFLKYYPIRNEIATLKYITNTDYMKLNKDIKDNNNWIVDKSKVMVMVRNVYKTNSNYGKLETEIKQPLKSIIKKYIKDFNVESGNNIFNIKMEYLSSRLGNTSNDIIGVKIGTSSIFKILCCEVVKMNDVEKKVELLKYYANIRGSSYKIIVDYYIYGNANDDTNSVISND